jgi:hypothetical protein
MASLKMDVFEAVFNEGKNCVNVPFCYLQKLCKRTVFKMREEEIFYPGFW